MAESSDADPPLRFIEAGRLAVMVHEKKVIGRRPEGVELLPEEQVADIRRDGIRCGLIYPGNDVDADVLQRLRPVRLGVPRFSVLGEGLRRPGDL